ncbi:C-X-C motif chemokine 2-like [Salarias fasciatus]|uniref:C-X-C motif chemokine 2-like n=1 Tax=Salarias fasciatus TaxID=181472 RepID=UPI001176B998|nr:C-X-C motif chemokine 2-like [Salarias fasciatus]
MNSTLWCMVLLACVSTCTSLVSKRCSCVTKRKRVKATLIVEIKERPPRSYCSSHEIIATLNPGGKSCLDPKSPFIQEAVRTFKKRKEEEMRSGNVNGTGWEPTATLPSTFLHSPNSTKTSPTEGSGGVGRGPSRYLGSRGRHLV